MRLGHLAAFAFVALPAFSPAGVCAAEFSANYFGEVPGKTFRMTPEVGDHQESWARQQGERARERDSAAPAPAPAETPTAPVYKRETPRSSRSWPGGKREISPAPKSPSGTDFEAEDLRDAPAALASNPNAVSLWRGLSRPMLLPAGEAASVSASEARELGRIDYENKILGQRVDASAPAGFPAADRIAPERKGMRAVVVTLDVSASPGDIRPALLSLPEGALKVERGEKGRFLGAGRTRALVRGWVPVGQAADLLRSEKVLRVESSVKKTAPAGFGEIPETQLLIGVRIPAEVSPNEAVRTTLQRLGKSAGFRFEKALAYQQIPGSSQLAVIVLGSVAIENIAGVMKDPGIVKVAPAPRPRQAAVPPTVEPRAKLASFLMQENPAYLPVFLIVAWFLWQNAFGKRRRAARL